METVGNWCRFRCVQCRLEFGGFGALNQHVKLAGHGQNNNGGKRVAKDYVTKSSLHTCRICGRGLLCDLHYLHGHLVTCHQVSLLQYCRRFGIAVSKDPSDDREDAEHDVNGQDEELPGPVDNDRVDEEDVKEDSDAEESDDDGDVSWSQWSEDEEESDMESKTSENSKSLKRSDDAEGVKVVTTVSSRCGFECVGCGAKFPNYARLNMHLRRKRCVGYAGRRIKWDFVKKRVFYRCLLCKQLVLCDVNFIKEHVSNKHKLSLKGYLKETGAPYERFRAPSVAMPKSSKGKDVVATLGNFCTFQCTECGDDFHLYSQFIKHQKRTGCMRRDKYRHVNLEDVIRRRVYYRCLLCKKLILNDNELTRTHIEGSHKTTVREYCAQTGAAREPKGKIQTELPSSSSAESRLAEDSFSEESSSNDLDDDDPLNDSLEFNVKAMARKDVPENDVEREEGGKSAVQEDESLSDDPVLEESSNAEAANKVEMSTDSHKSCKKPSKTAVSANNKELVKTVGNFCSFKCVGCQEMFSNYGILNVHLRQTSCGGDTKRHNIRKDFLYKKVYHRCLLCKKLVLSDVNFLKTHLRDKHKTNVSKYCAKKGLMREWGSGGMFLKPDGVVISREKAVKGVETAKKADDVDPLGIDTNEEDLVMNTSLHLKPEESDAPTGDADQIEMDVEEEGELSNLNPGESVTPTKATHANPVRVFKDNDGVAMTEELGNLCQYRCVRCEQVFDRRYLLQGHLRQTGHAPKEGRNIRRDFLTRSVYHECKICGEKVLCDTYFLSHHFDKKHRTNIGAYKRKYCQDRDKSEKIESVDGGVEQPVVIPFQRVESG